MDENPDLYRHQGYYGVGVFFVVQNRNGCQQEFFRVLINCDPIFSLEPASLS